MGMRHKATMSSASFSVRKYLDRFLPSPRSPAHGHLLNKRFLTNNPVAYEAAIAAAESYVAKLLEDGDIGWLYAKPFDTITGNPQYFRLMFDFLNILQAMHIPAAGRVLEIGSGPGWITEHLLMLGFTVDALEPSGDFIKIAQHRCDSLQNHHRLTGTPKVTFHQTTLEEIELEDQNFDAILFFDVLHHVVNEEVAIEKTFRYLKPGGCLGVVEGAWHPDFKALEQILLVEMAKYGTLENPFSTEYLDHLLAQNGFTDIQRYAAVNGFFSETQLVQPLAHFAAGGLKGSNNITARKPSDEDRLFQNCTNLNCKTDATLVLVQGGINAETRTVSVEVNLTNTGDTMFDNRAWKQGHVTLALRQGLLGSPGFLECSERHLLPEIVTPGKSVEMKLTYTLPSSGTLENWELDLIAEGAFWFSSRGIKSCPVPCI